MRGDRRRRKARLSTWQGMPRGARSSHDWAPADRYGAWYGPLGYTTGTRQAHGRRRSTAADVRTSVRRVVDLSRRLDHSRLGTAQAGQHARDERGSQFPDGRGTTNSSRCSGLRNRRPHSRARTSSAWPDLDADTPSRAYYTIGAADRQAAQKWGMSNPHQQVVISEMTYMRNRLTKYQPHDARSPRHDWFLPARPISACGNWPDSAFPEVPRSNSGPHDRRRSGHAGVPELPFHVRAGGALMKGMA